MAIQSSINNLLSQAQSLAAFYTGFKKADDIIKDTTVTKNEAKIQTDIAAGNAPMKDGKVDPEWLQKRREEFGAYSEVFDNDGNLTGTGEIEARFLENKVKRGLELDSDDKEFYNNPIVQERLKLHRERSESLISALDTLESSINPELKNEIARKVARASVEARTASINKAKSNFDEHTASLIKYYSKGSGNP